MANTPFKMKGFSGFHGESPIKQAGRYTKSQQSKAFGEGVSAREGAKILGTSTYKYNQMKKDYTRRQAGAGKTTTAEQLGGLATKLGFSKLGKDLTTLGEGIRAKRTKKEETDLDIKPETNVDINVSKDLDIKPESTSGTKKIPWDKAPKVGTQARTNWYKKFNLGLDHTTPRFVAQTRVSLNKKGRPTPETISFNTKKELEDYIKTNKSKNPDIFGYELDDLGERKEDSAFKMKKSPYKNYKKGYYGA